jgi:hypothetical protein
MELVLTPAEQGIEKLALELWRNIPKETYNVQEKVNECKTIPEKARQKLGATDESDSDTLEKLSQTAEKVKSMENYPQIVEQAKVKLAETFLELQTNMGEDYAKVKSEVFSMLDKLSAEEEDGESFKEQLEDLKKENKEFREAEKELNSDIRFEKRIKESAPHKYMQERIEKRFEDGRNDLLRAKGVKEEEQALEIGCTVGHMNSFLEDFINTKTELLKLINDTYVKYSKMYAKKQETGDRWDPADVALDLIEALTFPLDEFPPPTKGICHDDKVGYVKRIIKSISEGETSVYEAVKFAYKIQELREQTHDFDDAIDMAMTYIRELKTIKEEKLKITNDDPVTLWTIHQETVDKADELYREARVEELKAKPFWKKFYPAFIEAATFVKDENPTLQSEEFNRILTEKFGIENGVHSVIYAIGQLGSQYLVNKFIIIERLNNGASEVRPIYGKDGQAITPEEAYGVTPKKGKKIKEKKEGVRPFS